MSRTVQKKGSRKRKSTWFKAGHGGYRPCTRNKRQEVQAPVTTRIDETPVLDDVLSDAERGDAYVLRTGPLSQPEGEKNRMRLVHFQYTIELFLWAFKNHPHQSCKKFDLMIGKERRKGVVGALSLKCPNCDFETPLYKLYEEAMTAPGKRGPKPAVLNKAFDAALFHTSIGPHKGRTLLNALDIAVPSETSMNKLSAQVSDTLADAADRAMKEKARSSAKNNRLHMSADARYNTSRIGSDRRTGLSLTSQAHTLAIENETGHSYVVGAHTHNKICHIGAALRLKGENVECPGHTGCRATLNRFEPLTERAAGQSIASELAKMNITISHVCTDGDGKFHKGVQDVTDTPVIRLADTTHLAQTQMRRAKSVQWSDHLFPGVKTRGKKTLCENALATDIKNRSIAVLRQLHTDYAGNLEDIQKAAKKVIPAIIVCYQGDCRHCTRITTACAGGESGDNWIMKSSLLQEHNISGLQMTKTDVDNLTNILCLILGEEGLAKTRFLSNTQQNEAANRAMSVSLPKNIKFSTNLPGRFACCVDVWNHGPGEAQAMQMRALNIPITPGQGSFLRRQQKKSIWRKKYKRADTTKKQLKKRCSFLRAAKRKHQPQAEDEYCKHQLDDNPDHNDYHQVRFFFIQALNMYVYRYKPKI